MKNGLLHLYFYISSAFESWLENERKITDLERERVRKKQAYVATDFFSQIKNKQPKKAKKLVQSDKTKSFRDNRKQNTARKVLRAEVAN